MPVVVIDGESARNVWRTVAIVSVIALVCWLAWAFMPTEELLKGAAQ